MWIAIDGIFLKGEVIDEISQQQTLLNCLNSTCLEDLRVDFHT